MSENKKRDPNEKQPKAVRKALDVILRIADVEMGDKTPQQVFFHIVKSAALKGEVPPCIQMLKAMKPEERKEVAAFAGLLEQLASQVGSLVADVANELKDPFVSNSGSEGLTLSLQDDDAPPKEGEEVYEGMVSLDNLHVPEMPPEVKALLNAAKMLGIQVEAHPVTAEQAKKMQAHLGVPMVNASSAEGDATLMGDIIREMDKKGVRPTLSKKKMPEC